MGGRPYGVEWGDGQTYRYVWRDNWSEKAPMLVVLLIPSRANEDRMDSTVEFCWEVAQCDKQVGGLIVVNMYARFLAGTKSPGVRGRSASHTRAENVDVEDMVGPCNDNVIEEWAAKVRKAGGKIVVAWGTGGWSRHGKVLRLVRKNDTDELWCFGTKENGGKTSEGFPLHPSPRAHLRRKDGLGAAPADIVLRPF